MAKRVRLLAVASVLAALAAWFMFRELHVVAGGPSAGPGSAAETRHGSARGGGVAARPVDSVDDIMWDGEGYRLSASDAEHGGLLRSAPHLRDLFYDDFEGWMEAKMWTDLPPEDLREEMLRCTREARVQEDCHFAGQVVAKRTTDDRVQVVYSASTPYSRKGTTPRDECVRLARCLAKTRVGASFTAPPSAGDSLAFEFDHSTHASRGSEEELLDFLRAALKENNEILAEAEDRARGESPLTPSLAHELELRRRYAEYLQWRIQREGEPS